MTHLEFLTLFGSFTNEGQESSFKLPNTTNTQNVMSNLTKNANTDKSHRLIRKNKDGQQKMIQSKKAPKRSELLKQRP